MRTTVVIPTYNECENIAILVPQIFSLHIPDLNLIIVDDNSPDGTAEKIKELSKTYPIKLIFRTEKTGLGSAYVVGFKDALNSGAEIIIEMDADLSHDPNDLPRLISTLTNSDVAIGSRKIKGGKIIGWNFWRKFMSAGAMFFARTILGLKTHDVTSGFRAFRRSTLEKINLTKVSAGGYAFQEEIIYQLEKNNLNISEIPVTFRDRKTGKSKLSKKDILEFFQVILKIKYGK